MANDAAFPVVLASDELDEALRRRKEQRRTKASCFVLDDMLKGGIESGRITCISGDRASGKTTVYNID